MGDTPTEGTTPTTPPATSANATTEGKKRRVLIVEDTVELAEVIQATLERMDIEATTEAHGAKALELYEKMQPDVLLLDIGLPDMPGWKVLDAIKAKVQASPDTVLPSVIVITAYGDPANRLMGKLQEVMRYLIKPFTPDEVEQVVKEAFDDRQKKQSSANVETSDKTTTTSDAVEQKKDT